jgi:hypothetical protein
MHRGTKSQWWLYGRSAPRLTRRGDGDKRDDGEKQRGKEEPGPLWGGPGFRNDYRGEEPMTREELAARAQRMLWGTIGTLQEVEDTLDSFAELMPDSPEDMLEYRVPYDSMLEVDGAIRCSLNDDLRPMIARLKLAAVVTDEDLRRDWRETKAKRGERAN